MATQSLLPIVRAFAKTADIDVDDVFHLLGFTQLFLIGKDKKEQGPAPFRRPPDRPGFLPPEHLEG